MDREIKYSDPPYSALPADYLRSRIIGIEPPIGVVEDLFYALLWCKYEESGYLQRMHPNAELDNLKCFVWKGVQIVKG